MNSLEQVKSEIIEYGKKLIDIGLVAGTWGNISARTETNIVITRSGKEYYDMHPNDLVVLDLDGNTVEGTKKPSTELPIHMAIYKKRPDICAIVHTHSIYATAIAVTRKSIPAIVEDMAQIVGGEVTTAKYALPGSKELARNVIEALGQKNAALLANHGAIGVGRNLKEAFRVCQIIEKTANIYALSLLMGNPVLLDINDVEKMRNNYLEIYYPLAGK